MRSPMRFSAMTDSAASPSTCWFQCGHTMYAIEEILDGMKDSWREFKRQTR
jgi:hypothetical protein